MHAISQLINDRWKQRLVIALVPLILSACAALPDVSGRAPTRAITGSERTTLLFALIANIPWRRRKKDDRD